MGGTKKGTPWYHVTMSEIEQVTRAIFGSTPLRTGYSEVAEASYVVAADLKGAMKHGGNMNSFLRGLEKSQETAGQEEGVLIKNPLYVGLETVQTPGGPQQMKVVYKRGVFQLLMLSRKPEATAYRDKVFNVLEQIEREGYYLSESATQEQLDNLKEELELTEMEATGAYLQLEKAKSEAYETAYKYFRTSSARDTWAMNPFSGHTFELPPIPEKYLEKMAEWKKQAEEEGWDM